MTPGWSEKNTFRNEIGKRLKGKTVKGTASAQLCIMNEVAFGGKRIAGKFALDVFVFGFYRYLLKSSKLFVECSEGWHPCDGQIITHLFCICLTNEIWDD